MQFGLSFFGQDLSAYSGIRIPHSISTPVCLVSHWSHCSTKLSQLTCHLHSLDSGTWNDWLWRVACRFRRSTLASGLCLHKWHLYLMATGLGSVQAWFQGCLGLGETLATIEWYLSRGPLMPWARNLRSRHTSGSLGVFRAQSSPVLSDKAEWICQIFLPKQSKSK